MSDLDVFLASAERRQTDVRILEVILHLADGDPAEAERIWRTPSEPVTTRVLEPLRFSSGLKTVFFCTVSFSISAMKCSRGTEVLLPIL